MVLSKARIACRDGKKTMHEAVTAGGWSGGESEGE